MSSLFEHVVHPRLEQRRREGPPQIADERPAGSRVARFNTRLGLGITLAVGSMWAAYAFTTLALISLPAAVRSQNAIVIVAWIAQTFLQLVLLPIIIVGQNVQGAAADRRAKATYDDADAILHTALRIQEHLLAQDEAIVRILDHLGIERPPVIRAGEPVGASDDAAT
jgi:hypothetical protein